MKAKLAPSAFTLIIIGTAIPNILMFYQFGYNWNDLRQISMTVTEPK